MSLKECEICFYYFKLFKPCLNQIIKKGFNKMLKPLLL